MGPTVVYSGGVTYLKLYPPSSVMYIKQLY